MQSLVDIPQGDIVEAYRWFMGTMVSLLGAGIWYLFRTKAADEQIQKQIEDLKHETELIVGMLNQRMDRIQHDLGEHMHHKCDPPD